MTERPKRIGKLWVNEKNVHIKNLLASDYHMVERKPNRIDPTVSDAVDSII
jgi:hypothetical protein